ncbi:hypothetical protein [Ilumatobacter nonamiensis]|uniref:hypothetical protein n=1 Tax=Ilumatobacter nonamiensis TaxID=467093 RepID=UPI00034C6CAB|nr:hypothetical protein [Ilumatobacter nonamiensis]
MERSSEFTDAELTALALATDPDDVEIDADAEPFGVDGSAVGLLPDWYMPARMSSSGPYRRRRAGIVVGLIAAMLIVNGAGLCVTYGIPEVGDRVSTLW